MVAVKRHLGLESSKIHVAGNSRLAQHGILTGMSPCPWLGLLTMWGLGSKRNYAEIEHSKNPR